MLRGSAPVRILGVVVLLAYVGCGDGDLALILAIRELCTGYTQSCHFFNGSMDKCTASFEEGADEAEQEDCYVEYKAWILCWSENYDCHRDSPDDVGQCLDEIETYWFCMPLDSEGDSGGSGSAEEISTNEFEIPNDEMPSDEWFYDAGTEEPMEVPSEEVEPSCYCHDVPSSPDPECALLCEWETYDTSNTADCEQAQQAIGSLPCTTEASLSLSCETYNTKHIYCNLKNYFDCQRDAYVCTNEDPPTLDDSGAAACEELFVCE